jgi:hypothetical protein
MTATSQSTRKVVLITGASSGIGAATARLLATAGHAVVMGAKRSDLLDQLQEEIRVGGEALALQLDVSDPESIDAFVSQAETTFGPADVLVNNAGVMPLSFLRDRRGRRVEPDDRRQPAWRPPRDRRGAAGHGGPRRRARHQRLVRVRAPGSIPPRRSTRPPSSQSARSRRDCARSPRASASPSSVLATHARSSPSRAARRTCGPWLRPPRTRSVCRRQP